MGREPSPEEIPSLAKETADVYFECMRVARELGRGWTLRAGYRMVEGGADVKPVYTFAWLHNASLGVGWSW